jgi:hypothetical protein
MKCNNTTDYRQLLRGLNCAISLDLEQVLNSLQPLGDLLNLCLYVSIYRWFIQDPEEIQIRYCCHQVRESTRDTESAFAVGVQVTEVVMYGMKSGCFVIEKLLDGSGSQSPLTVGSDHIA